MVKRISYIIVAVIIAAVALFIWYIISGGKKPPQNPMGMAPVVTVQTPVVQNVEDYYDFTGNTASIEAVDIRARVEGFLTGIHFTDGQDVTTNDLLFTIEPESFRAKRDQAKATLLSSQAELQRAQADYERTEKAVQTNAVSKQDLSNSKANRDKAKAQVMSAKADLENADLNLSYTSVATPITGRVSRRYVDLGNLVGGSRQTLLATVVRLQPMYVYFNVSENIFEQYFITHDHKDTSNKKQKLYIGLAQQEDYPYEGFLNYIDNKVDSETGTIVLRGEIPNKEKLLLPGMFVKIRFPAGIKKNAILIKEQAVNSDIGGKFVFTLDPNNIVSKKYVKLGRKVGELRVIESGINSKQRYIVSGFHFVRAGAPVTPIPEQAEREAPQPANSTNEKKP